MFASKNVRVCLAFGAPELRCSAETAESENSVFCPTSTVIIHL